MAISPKKFEFEGMRMIGHVNLILPWPPSVNRYWRRVNRGALAGRVLLSSCARDYRRDVAVAARAARVKEPIGGPLEVRLIAHAPDRRKRDLDNLLKASLDGLAHAGIFYDDSQISRLAIEWGPPRKTGALSVSIKRYEPLCT